MCQEGCVLTSAFKLHGTVPCVLAIPTSVVVLASRRGDPLDEGEVAVK